MPVKCCTKCGLPHTSDAEWKNICFPCWKEEKGYTPTTGDKAYKELQSAYAALQKQTVISSFRGDSTALTPALIKDMIVLCHPDKHGGSERATRITQWLTRQRRKE